ncbi:MAG: hypothetical protein KDC05_17065 [Bacteroidales bacterium]|nr:hypothetical protein [Bacteroidales bacterium]
MANTKSVMVLVRDKIVYIDLGEILKQGRLSIDDIKGNTVYKAEIADSHYEVIILDQPRGKYWVNITSDSLKTKKSFHIK